MKDPTFKRARHPSPPNEQKRLKDGVLERKERFRTVQRVQIATFPSTAFLLEIVLWRREIVVLT